MIRDDFFSRKTFKQPLHPWMTHHNPKVATMQRNFQAHMNFPSARRWQREEVGFCSLGDVFLDSHVSNQKGPENGGTHDLIEGNMFPNPKKCEEKLRKRLWYRYQQQLLIFRGRFWCWLFFIFFKHAFQPPAEKPALEWGKKNKRTPLKSMQTQRTSRLGFEQKKGRRSRSVRCVFSALEVEGRGEHPFP